MNTRAKTASASVAVGKTMSLKYLVIGIIGLLVIGGGVYLVSALGSGQDAPRGIKESVSEMPEVLFEVYTPQTLEHYRGKPIIANSWAIWCPFCVEELKVFARVQRDFGDEIVILAINRQESASAQQQYLRDLGVLEDLNFLLDPADSFYRDKLKGFSMPETLFIDREGNVQFHKRGPMDETEIRQRLEQIL